MTRGGGGVKNLEKHGDVICGSPLINLILIAYSYIDQNVAKLNHYVAI